MSRFAIAPLLLAGALGLPLAAPALAAPTAPGGLGGVLVAAGVGRGAYGFPLEAGQKVTIERYTMAPGEVIRWGRQPSTVLVFTLYGDLINYKDCRTKQFLQFGQAHYIPRSQAAGTLGGMTANETDEDAEVLVLRSDVPGVPQRHDQLHLNEEGQEELPPEPAAGCPTGPSATPTELGTAVATSSTRIEQLDHEIIGVYRYTLAPGASTGWHLLPDPGFVLQTRGRVQAKQDCGAGGTRAAGKAYVQTADERAQLIANTSTEPAEFLHVALSMPNFYPPDIPPTVPALPPSECLDQLLS